MNSVIQNAKRLIIKVGSSLVTNDGHGLDHAAIGKWSEQIAKLRLQGERNHTGQLRRYRGRHAATGFQKTSCRYS